MYPSLVTLALLPVLTVSVGSTTLGSVPQGAQHVPLLSLHLTAPCDGEGDGDIAVESLTLRREGRGAASDLLRVYAVSENRRVSRGVAVRDEPFSLPLRLFSVPACGSADLAIQTDLSPTAAATGEHRLTVESIAANAAVSIRATGPVDAPSRVVPRAEIPSVTLTFRPTLSSLWYGQRREVGRFELRNDGPTDVRLTAITLRNNGSASDGDLQNLFLESSRGERVTNVTSRMDGRIVRITFDPPFELRRGQSRLLRLRADFLASVRRKVRWELEESSDIEVQ